ncbi:MAG: MBL fold metallo-hydrolase, partial [Candidatus Zambryskibacteria bacterium]|nr:MBL fold metallo-hydrolase [Candidatus Zambryskibacteria bacterium]
MNNILTVTFYGGVGSVTGANFLLQDSNTKILVDCGLQQGSVESYENNKRAFAYNPAEMDYLFITHAHLDHIGRVCKLVRDGFRGTIYSTPETRELATVMLADALRVMEMKEREFTDGPKESPLYDIKDFNQAFSLWKTIPYHTDFKINEDFSVYLKDAGHILGSSMYEFSYKGNLSTRAEYGTGQRKIVFTG